MKSSTRKGQTMYKPISPLTNKEKLQLELERVTIMPDRDYNSALTSVVKIQDSFTHLFKSKEKSR